MNRNTVLVCKWAVFGAVLAGSGGGWGVAYGQPLPPPPPFIAPPPPPSAPVRAEGLAEFVAAYKRAERPKLLIRPLVQTTLGETPHLARVGDYRGTATLIVDRIRSRFVHPDIALMSEAFQSTEAAQALEGATGADVNRQAMLLGKAYNAGVVFLFRFIEQPPDAAGVRFVGSYALVDMRSGRELGSYAWTMVPDAGNGFSAARAEQYAAELSKRIVQDFVAQFPEQLPGATAAYRDFVLKLVGSYSDDDVIALRDAVQGAKGVEADSVSLVSESQDLSELKTRQIVSAVESDAKVLEFSLRFAGDRLRLRQALAASVRRDLKLEPRILSQTDSEIVAQLKPRAIAGIENFLSGGPETEENREARKRLVEVYRRSAEPTIAVVVSNVIEQPKKAAEAGGAKPAEPVKPAEKADEKKPETKDAEAKPTSTSGAAASASAAPTIIIQQQIGNTGVAAGVIGGGSESKPGSGGGGGGGGGGDGDKADREFMELLDTKFTEDRMYARLVDLQLKTVDPTTKADILISGVGRRVGVGGVRYSFRMVRVQDGQVLGAATIERSLFDGPDKGTGSGQKINNVNPFLESVAEEATGKLMGQFYNGSLPAQQLEVTLANVTNDRQVEEVMSFLRKRFRKDSDGEPLVLSTTFVERVAGKEGGGVARFRVGYRSDFDRFKSELLGAEGLPFEFDEGGSDRNKLALRIKEKK